MCHLGSESPKKINERGVSWLKTPSAVLEWKSEGRLTAVRVTDSFKG